MTLPQDIWNIIRHDKRFLAASKTAQHIFINKARRRTWNMAPAKAELIFRSALDESFGPLCTCTDYGPTPQPERCVLHRSPQQGVRNKTDGT